jgi:hypothetical protein
LRRESPDQTCLDFARPRPPVRRYGAPPLLLKAADPREDVGAVDPNDPPSKRFEIDDWHIDIMLFGGFREDVVPTDAIAAAMGDGRVVSAETEIREALSAKAKRYGKHSRKCAFMTAIGTRRRTPPSRHRRRAAFAQASPLGPAR